MYTLGTNPRDSASTDAGTGRMRSWQANCVVVDEGQWRGHSIGEWLVIHGLNPLPVKASATVKSGDFAGLRALAEACGDRFAFGTVLYDSTDVVPFGDRLAAAPLSCLWS